jgi:hypothetical protein
MKFLTLLVNQTLPSDYTCWSIIIFSKTGAGGSPCGLCVVIKIRGVWPLLVLHISEIARATANLLEDSRIYKTYRKLPKYSTDKKT